MSAYVRRSSLHIRLNRSMTSSGALMLIWPSRTGSRLGQRSTETPALSTGAAYGMGATERGLSNCLRRSISSGLGIAGLFKQIDNFGCIGFGVEDCLVDPVYVSWIKLPEPAACVV